MVNNFRIWQSLLWKDMQSLKLLVLAICGAIVVINAVLFAITLTVSQNGADDTISWAIMMWILMPNLVALGAPPMLVGNEEESGTIGWLRMLPVNWHTITLSKVTSGFAAVVLTWALASLVLLMIRLTWSPNVGVYAAEIQTVREILNLAFFSGLLLVTGFVTAFMFRSPVAGVVAVIPLIVAVSMFSFHVKDELAGPSYGTAESASLNRMVLPILMTAAEWAVGIGIVLLLARRRLFSPEGTRIKNLTTDIARGPEPYRPTVGPGFFFRPSPIRALLWQQSRQSTLQAVCLTLLMIVSAVLATQGRDYRPVHDSWIRIFAEISPLVLVIGASWIGALAFFGDTIRRRCAYFADRGISPTLVWWTRLIQPAGYCLVVIVIGLISQWLASGERVHGGRESSLVLVLIPIGFAFGQLVSMWAHRPILSLFAGPTYMLFSMIGIMFLMSVYYTYCPALLLIVPVLLLATWRLTGRWMDGRVDGAFHWRVLGYTVAAVMLPCVVIMGSRWSAMPAPLTEWRQQLAMTEVSVVEPAPVSFDVLNNAQKRQAYPVNYYGLSDRYLEGLRAELASETFVGSEVSFQKIETALGTYPRYPGNAGPATLEMQKLSVEVLLKWSRVVREMAAAEPRHLAQLENVAEPAERLAVEALEEMLRKSPQDKTLAQLVDSIPDAELRRQSRRNSLLYAWQFYNVERSGSAAGLISGEPGERFAGKNLAPHASHFLIERVMAGRHIDQAVKLTLEQLDSGLPLADSAAYGSRMNHWHAAEGPVSKFFSPLESIAFTQLWTKDHEDRVDLLRLRVSR